MLSISSSLWDGANTKIRVFDERLSSITNFRIGCLTAVICHLAIYSFIFFTSPYSVTNTTGTSTCDAKCIAFRHDVFPKTMNDAFLRSNFSDLDLAKIKGMQSNGIMLSIDSCISYGVTLFDT